MVFSFRQQGNTDQPVLVKGASQAKLPVSHVVKQVCAGKQVVTIYLRAREEPVLFCEAQNHVGALSQAVVRDVGAGSTIGLTSKQLPLRACQNPNLENGQ
jgi:hypothetical protein